MVEMNDTTLKNITEEKDEASTVAEMKTELSTLKDNVTDVSAYFKDSFQRIESNIEKVEFNLSAGDSMRVGKDAVQPLIGMKTYATDILINIRNNKINIFEEEIDFEPFVKHINATKQLSAKVNQCTNRLNVILDGIIKIEKLKKQNVSANEESSNSAGSSNEPSTCSFSLFDGSSSNVATSSPLPPQDEENQV